MESDDLSYEPMEIDLSSQSVKDMDISDNDSDIDFNIKTRPYSRLSVSSQSNQLPNSNKSPSRMQSVKNYHINICRPTRNYKNRLFKIIVSLIIVFILIIYNVHSLNCCDQLNLEILRETLSNKIYGQPEAINLLTETLDLKARSKILFFIGGTGVGKTFTSSLLLDTIGSCSNVYHYTMPTFQNTFSTDLMFGLTMCKMSLIIVDDLSLNDVDVKIQIQNLIEKSESLEKEITVILIYNCKEGSQSFEMGCDKSFNTKLSENFSEIRVLKRFIRFESLSEKHLKECVKQELGDKKLTELEFESLLKNFNVSIDGCKGVHSKMMYLRTI